MPLHKMIHRLVPARPIRSYTNTVPPVAIELAVTKSHHFSERIQRALEDKEEASEPAEERDRGQLHDAFDDGYQVQCCNMVETVLEQRNRVLGAGDPDHDG